jgi:hypothetical protein
MKLVKAKIKKGLTPELATQFGTLKAKRKQFQAQVICSIWRNYERAKKGEELLAGWIPDQRV